jgi:hypothetical protein
LFAVRDGARCRYESQEIVASKKENCAAAKAEAGNSIPRLNHASRQDIEGIKNFQAAQNRQDARKAQGTHKAEGTHKAQGGKDSQDDQGTKAKDAESD